MSIYRHLTSRFMNQVSKQRFLSYKIYLMDCGIMKYLDMQPISISRDIKWSIWVPGWINRWSDAGKQQVHLDETNFNCWYDTTILFSMSSSTMSHIVLHCLVLLCELLFGKRCREPWKCCAAIRTANTNQLENGFGWRRPATYCFLLPGRPAMTA